MAEEHCLVRTFPVHALQRGSLYGRQSKGVAHETDTFRIRRRCRDVILMRVYMSRATDSYGESHCDTGV